MVFSAHAAMMLCSSMSASIALATTGATREDVARLRFALLLRWAAIVATAIYMDEERKVRELWD